MDFRLPEEANHIYGMALSFGRENFLPHAPRWDKEEIFPVDVIKSTASLGFGGLFVSPSYGGCGLSRLEGALVFEGLSQGCVSTAAYLSIHNMVAGLIEGFGTTSQKEQWLPPLVALDILSSYCLTEPQAGSDASSLKTLAEKISGGYLLKGTKVFISGAGVSDVYLVMARTGGQGAKGISAFLVEKETPGLSFGQKEYKMGWRSQPTRMVHFDNCFIPQENLLGEEGKGFNIAMTGLDGGRLNIAACSLGGGLFCLEQAKTYVKMRHQFGQSLSTLQSVQFKIAQMETQLQAARLMVYKAAQDLSLDLQGVGDKKSTLSCAMAKKLATDAGFFVANEALQLHGGYGYIHEYHMERLVRDLRVHQILEGTNEIMNLIIARKVLGE